MGQKAYEKKTKKEKKTKEVITTQTANAES